MGKKYLVLVLNNPYGRDDGFQTHPATVEVLNNKLYNTKEEAEQAAEILRKKVSHEEIKKEFHIIDDVFYELRDFILKNTYINVNGIVIKCTYTKNELIDMFMKMYGFDKTKYTECDFEHDETVYQRLMGEEPKIDVVEVNM